jgi:hypothetical protein
MLEEFPEQDQVYEADVEMVDDLGGMCFFLGFTIRADKHGDQEPRAFDEGHQRSSEVMTQ